MLERLDQIDGVEASSANHLGTMIRLAVTSAAKREKVAEDIQKRLAAAGNKPSRLTGDELKAVLQREQWRVKEQIGELTAIEFRKLALDRVQAFLKSEKTADATAGKLLKIAEAQWDRLAQEAEIKEPKQLPHKRDWKRRCREFAQAFTEQAKELLTDEQRRRLKEMVEHCFSPLPDPVK